MICFCRGEWGGGGGGVVFEDPLVITLYEIDRIELHDKFRPPLPFSDTPSRFAQGLAIISNEVQWKINTFIYTRGF